MASASRKANLNDLALIQQSVKPSAPDTGKAALYAYTDGRLALEFPDASEYVFEGSTSPLTTKGDILTYSTAPTRLGIGAVNSVFVADSAQTTGNKWTTALTGLTVDNSVIGGITPAAATFTTLTANTALVASLVKPPSDSTTALLITKADGVTPIVTFDSTNNRTTFAGNAGFAGTAPLANTVVTMSKSYTDPTGLTIGFDGLISTTYTSPNSNAIAGVRGRVNIDQTGANATNTFYRGVQGTAAAIGSANTVTGLAGVYSSVANTGAGTLANGYGIYIDLIGNTGGGTLQTAYGAFVAAQTSATTNYAFYANGAGRISFVGSDTVVSAAGATWKGIEFRAATATISGSTNITTTTGFNYVDIAQPTLSAGTALTITNAATVYIANAPAAGGAGPATITNAYALWVDNGVARFDGNLDVSSASINVLVNSAGLNFVQATLGNAVQSLISTATNDDPTEIVYQNRLATTDGVQTTMHTFTVPASTTYAIEAVVIARRTGGSAGTAEDGARYKVQGVYKNVAGSATIIGAVTVSPSDESQAAFDATFTTSGATVLLKVTGATNNNITWHMTARVWLVST